MYLEQCNAKQIQQIYEEFNVTEDSLKRDTRYLMEWLEKQPHLPNVKDEAMLTNILLNCKNSLEKTKQQLEIRYTLRALQPEIYANRDPCDNAFKNVLDTLCIIPLPKLTPEGDRVYIFRVFNADTVNMLSTHDYMKAITIKFDISLKADTFRKYIIIYDLENMSMSLAYMIFEALRKYASMRRTSSLSFKILVIVRESYNSILKSSTWSDHVRNLLRLCDLYRKYKVDNLCRKEILFSTFKAGMQELKSTRILKIIVMNVDPRFHTIVNFAKKHLGKNMVQKYELWTEKGKDLRNILPDDILPSNYGGKEKSLEKLRDLFHEYTKEFRDWLKCENDVKADFSKKVDGIYEYKQNLSYGIDGAFRQLCVD